MAAAEEVVEEVVEEVEASVTAEAKAVPWAVREVVEEVEASVTAEAKAVPWAVREVDLKAARKVRRLEVREAFQPASPGERLPPVLKARLVNRSLAPKEERGSRS